MKLALQPGHLERLYRITMQLCNEMARLILLHVLNTPDVPSTCRSPMAISHHIQSSSKHPVKGQDSVGCDNMLQMQASSVFLGCARIVTTSLLNPLVTRHSLSRLRHISQKFPDHKGCNNEHRPKSNALEKVVPAIPRDCFLQIIQFLPVGQPGCTGPGSSKMQ